MEEKTRQLSIQGHLAVNPRHYSESKIACLFVPSHAPVLEKIVDGSEIPVLELPKRKDGRFLDHPRHRYATHHLNNSPPTISYRMSN